MGKTLREPTLTPKEDNDLYINVLKTVLKKFDIPEGFCSFGEYAEEAVCLEKNAPSWIVYDGERGKKYNIKTHMDCRDACYDMIARISESTDNEKELKDFFHRECEKNRFSHFGYTDYRKQNNKSDIVPIMGADEFEKRASTVIHS